MRRATLGLGLVLAACAPAEQAGQSPDGRMATPAPDSAAVPQSAAAGDTAEAADSVAIGGGVRSIGEWVRNDAATIPVPLPPPDTDAYIADYEEGTSIVASMGPYAFLFTSAYSYSCGAHGNRVASFLVMDVRTGRAVDLVGLMGGEPLVAQVAPQARAAFHARPDSLGTPFEPDSVRVTMVAPVWRRGSLALLFQFTSEACYACSDGAWSSYFVSEWIPTPVVPPDLRSWAAAPDPAAAILDSVGPAGRAGWSTAGDTLFVWSAARGEETAVYVRGASGWARQEPRPGIVIADGPYRWTWRLRDERVRTTPCEQQPN